jgi:recombination protein RecA
MSQALRKLTGACARGKTLVLFINQLRMKIGVMFGNPETTTGGNALKFYASVRLDVRRIGALKDGEQVVGNRTRVKVVKNKLAAPFRETEFDVGYGQGISRAGEIIDLGVEAGLLEKSGAWIGYGGERLGNGREAARQHLCEHQELLRELRGKLLARAGIGAAAASGANGANGANGTNGASGTNGARGASAANGASAASAAGGSGGVAGGASVTGAAASVAPAPRVVAPVAARKVA